MDAKDYSLAADWRKMQYLKMVWTTAYTKCNGNIKNVDTNNNDKQLIILEKDQSKQNLPDLKELADIALIMIEYLIPKSKEIIQSYTLQDNDKDIHR